MRKFRYIICLLLIIALVPSFVLGQDLGDVDQQIQDYESQLDQTQKESTTLQSQIESFDQSIGNLQGEITDTQNQINEKEKTIVSLSEEIDTKQKELEHEKGVLAQSLKFLYEVGDTPMLELFLSSKSISAALDQMEYISWVEKRVEETIDKIDKAKKQIEADKKQQEEEKVALINLRDNQNLQLAAQGDKRAAKNELLVYTQNNEQIYEQKLSDLYALRTYLSQLYNESVASGGTGGYPFADYPPDSDTGGYGPARECTSYVAWKRASVGNPLSFSWGNAGQWAGQAQAAGYSVDQNPKAGDVMVFLSSNPGMEAFGHVAYVESVNGDGTVNISEYNYNWNYSYNSRSNVNPWNYDVRFIH